MKNVLMIAFHFPPIRGSSGVQRTLRFAQYLPEFGWRPTVLTVHPRAYGGTTQDQMSEVRPDVEVIRAPGWDIAKVFAKSQRYPGALARPDRWTSWWLGAVPAAMGVIARSRPQVVWSTYPIATAHLIGQTLACLTRIPWIADFRDPMAQDGYPADPLVWRSFERIERSAVKGARFSVFTTPSAVADYRSRYPSAAERIRLIENGYDEETFSDLPKAGEPLNPGRLTLLHSGIVYPSERDPTQIFAALAGLRDSDPSLFARLRLRFRAPAHVPLLTRMAATYDVESAIEILPSIGYREALREMTSADGLLVLQAANCNAQIPAKFYEYLRAGTPMLVLTDAAGDTARVARNAGIDAIAALDDARAIAQLFVRWMCNPSMGTLPRAEVVPLASRRARTAELATLLDSVTSAPGTT